MIRILKDSTECSVRNERKGKKDEEEIVKEQKIRTRNR